MLRIDYEPPKVYRLKYIIASTTNMPDLHDKVNELLSEGRTKLLRPLPRIKIWTFYTRDTP